MLYTRDINERQEEHHDRELTSLVTFTGATLLSTYLLNYLSAGGSDPAVFDMCVDVFSPHTLSAIAFWATLIFYVNLTSSCGRAHMHVCASTSRLFRGDAKDILGTSQFTAKESFDWYGSAVDKIELGLDNDTHSSRSAFAK
ncbi:hypothetical protein BDW22DRAFT_1346555 [Trametopsis cervina]|nr:hypothetical protein BDW22DRAFT_1346555 [Trametopsis cervina]